MTAMEKQPFLDQGKTYDYDEESPASTSNAECARRGRIARASLASSIISLLFLSWTFIPIPNIRFFSCHRSSHSTNGLSSTSMGSGEMPLMVSPQEESTKVPFEAHIMSKCPDAQACLQQLVVPAMEQIHDKVDFNLSFIASVSDKSSDIECMHGPGECIGNILMLCAQNLPFPDGSHNRMPTVRSLGFANCLTSSYEDIPGRPLVEHCALEYGIDFDALNRCASKQEDDTGNDGLSGIALLRDSAIHSADLEVHTSCTVRLDETVWCVRDGGKWKDCAHDGEGSDVSVLVSEVKKLYEERN